jgi:hypothetical protein
VDAVRQNSAGTEPSNLHAHRIRYHNVT